MGIVNKVLQSGCTRVCIGLLGFIELCEVCRGEQ